jgi:hypothetical protein
MSGTYVPEDEIKFHGHPNVLSFHPRTIEITKADSLTLHGDCIIGVRADKACADLSDSVKSGLKRDGSVINIEIAVGSESFRIRGNGDSRLILSDRHDIVIRKTRFVCPRTMSVKCTAASSDLPRTMIEALQDSNTTGIFRVSVD